MSGAPRLVIAAGGTGGHMFPAQALAEEMLARGWRVALATDARGLRYADGFPEAVERIGTRSATFAQGGLTARLGAPVTILRGVLSMIWRFRHDRPAAVAGFGGYPSIPALAAAAVLGLPRLIHEQNGVLGRVNRLFARRVGLVACGTWPMAETPPGAVLEPVGNPVRARVLEAAETPYTPPGDDALSLLVFGGSQGASALSRLVPGAVSLLPEALRARLSVTQQVREGEEAAVRETYRAAGVRAETAPFFADLPERIAGAQLVVSRAGASTLAEIAAIGRPAILVPYPHAMDDHQSANAAALAAQGGAVVAGEDGLTAESLSRELRALLTDPGRAAGIAAGARRAARPAAARDLADRVAQLAGRA